MKMPMIAILAFGIALGAVLTAAADNSETPTKSQLSALREQVRALEERVAVLEKRLERRPLDLDPRVTSPLLRRYRLPKGWDEREFNGIPYYVMPLQQDPNRTPRPRK